MQFNLPGAISIFVLVLAGKANRETQDKGENFVIFLKEPHLQAVAFFSKQLFMPSVLC
jgi:hypothetical protein